LAALAYGLVGTRAPHFYREDYNRTMAKYSRALLARAKKIKLLLMDVDGVLTNGTFYYVPLPNGGMLETKGFDSRDGLGLRLAHHAGIKTGIITGRSSPVIEHRAKELGIEFLRQNATEKIAPYEEMLAAAHLTDAEVCYMGDDLTDLPLLTRVGLGVSVANGDPLVRKHARFTTRRVGGAGAVRETVELILTAQGKWEGIQKSYLKGDRKVNLDKPDKGGKGAATTRI
jgi:3-deoxy-D-manno-octulosonate 8-phosphate phosphatase (KDO 8-P phosphatase)